jgi:hypothetical protein
MHPVQRDQRFLNEQPHPSEPRPVGWVHVHDGGAVQDAATRRPCDVARPARPTVPSITPSEGLSPRVHTFTRTTQSSSGAAQSAAK